MVVISGAIAHTRAFFGQGTGPILLSHLACSGTEQTLLDCSINVIINCHHRDDVGVSCPPRGMRNSTHTHTHSYTHSCTHALTHFPTHSLTLTCTRILLLTSYTHTLILSCMYICTHSLAHSLTHPLTHPLTHSPTHTHICTHSSLTYTPTRSILPFFIYLPLLSLSLSLFLPSLY